MTALEEVQGVYDAYLDAIAEKKRTLRFGEGMMGFRGGLADAPCNEDFIRALGQVLDRAAGQTDSAGARELMEYVYRQPLERRCERAAHWMLLAAHALTEPLVGLLSPADATGLADWYEAHYPKRDRLPAHKKLLSALKTQAGEK